MLEGGVGLSGGEPSVSLRALSLRRPTLGWRPWGEESRARASWPSKACWRCSTICQLERSLDESAGIWLFRREAGGTPQQPTAASRPALASGWTTALEASAETNREPALIRARGGRRHARPDPVSAASSPRRRPPDAHPRARRHRRALCVRPMRHRQERRRWFTIFACTRTAASEKSRCEMLRVARLDDATGARRFRLERRI